MKSNNARGQKHAQEILTRLEQSDSDDGVAGWREFLLRRWMGRNPLHPVNTGSVHIGLMPARRATSEGFERTVTAKLIINARCPSLARRACMRHHWSPELRGCRPVFLRQ